ncbi:MAG: hypothetical protein ACI9SK_002055 [Zhongshania sp.]|jgi:hypothetical protein
MPLAVLESKAKWFINASSGLLVNAWASRQGELGLITQLKQASEKSLAEFRKQDPDVETNEFNDITSMNTYTFSDQDTASASAKYSKDFGIVSFFESLNTNIIVGWSELSAPYAIDGDFSPIDFLDFGTEKPNHYEQHMGEWQTGGVFPGLITFFIG